MKIDNTLNSLTGVRGKGNVAVKGKSREPRSDSGGVHDSVNLSSDSSRLQALEAALAEIDIEDTDKIESIRQAIASGQFQVDEEVVAEKMVESTIEQLRHQNP
ncbi:MAG: flagellar biosynthesis anti-sigma factor FlgM [Hydrogenophilales bacterium]|nr:flagellar biosynthesis anti-sigma factor FlgM [Hydrogenophilales bacterium]